jgi:O-antigen/teichoic acid export membrane protein
MNLSKVAQNIRFIPKLFSDHSLTKKASLNALAAGLDYVANILVAFIVTPFMVTGLGDYYYGAWQILQRLVGYISPASGRPTQALKFTLANEQNSADFDRKRSYVGSTMAVFVLFLPVMAVLGGLLTWSVPYWIKTPPAYIWNVRLACTLLVINLITTTLVAVPRSVLEGENIGYKRMGLSAALVFIGGGLTWVALYLKTGLIGVAGSTLLASIISGIFFLQVVRTYAPWFGVGKPSKEAVRGFLGLSGWFMAWNLIMNLMMASDVVVLGLLNSVESVTNYSLSKYAPETSISIVAIMVFGILPGLGGIIGSGDLERAARVRGEIMSLTWLVVTVIGTGVVFWNHTFIGLWVGAKHFVGPLPNLLIVVLVLQFVLIRTDANVIDLTLNLNRKVILGAISVAVSLITASSLVYFFKWGIIGVSIGIIIGRLILSVEYPILIGRMLKIPHSAQLKAILRPALVTTILFLAAAVLDNLLPIRGWHSLGGWLAFLLSAGVTFCVVFALAFIGGLSNKQQRNILRRISAVLVISSPKNKA